jgi:predicted O-methyltransferase YrrM
LHHEVLLDVSVINNFRASASPREIIIPHIMNSRLTELLSYLDHQQEGLAAAVASIPPDRRGDSPGPGRWSTAEVIEHLAVVERRLAKGFANWLAEARANGVPPEHDTTPILPAIDTARVLSRSSRLVAPELVRPASRLTADDAWRALEEARAEVKRVVLTADGLALSLIVKPHPLFGPLTMYEWIAFIGAHSARHAAQIHEIGAALSAQQQWTDVDGYLSDLLLPADAALDDAVAASAAAGLPAIQVSPHQGKLLQIFARMVGARAILEIGTLGGYSTIWLARALPAGGRMVTLEADPAHADVARANLARAGLAALVDVRLGRALDTLPALTGPFDLVFIDADKPNIPEYFQWAMRLSRPGGVIVVDNVIRDGAVIDKDSPDPNVQGVRRFNDLLAAESGVSATTIQTVGSKGYDGFTIAIVRG